MAKTLPQFTLALAILLVTSCISASIDAPGADRITVSAGGHYIVYGGKTLMLIGDSGTQCVAQNANVDYRRWVDDCANRGIRMVHVWSFMGPRQKADGSAVERRWGYVFPGLTPWARRASGPPAADLLRQWDLTAFDDGSDDDLDRYWPRLRDLCAYARGRGLMVGITVFTGWSKGNHDAWTYHPFNVANGGHLTDNKQAVVIASPGTEICRESWSEDWPDAKKTQWVWERLSEEYINQLNGFGNVFFVFFDEHSYSEGNMGDHFLEFFRKRGALWADWDARRGRVDFVYSDTVSGADKNALAVGGFTAAPTRPYLLLEGPPYAGDDVRSSIWTFCVGGGHYTFHGDERQETPRTGIMGYDPRVPDGDPGMDKRDWLGHASRFFNEHVVSLDAMRPHNDLCDGAYCLADPGREYVVYSKRDAAAEFTTDLSGVSGQVHCRFYDPRTGTFGKPFTRTGGAVESFTKPDANDWTLHIVAGKPADASRISAAN